MSVEVYGMERLLITLLVMVSIGVIIVVLVERRKRGGLWGGI